MDPLPFPDTHPCLLLYLFFLLILFGVSDYSVRDKYLHANILHRNFLRFTPPPSAGVEDGTHLRRDSHYARAKLRPGQILHDAALLPMGLRVHEALYGSFGWGVARCVGYRIRLNLAEAVDTITL